MTRPDVLYHGSRQLLSVLEPLVNAAHDRNVAMPFALAFTPDERGRSRWTLEGSRLVVTQGSLDTTGIGYLYRVAADRFEQVNPMVWVCREPVTPIDYEIVRSADYVDWITRS